VVAAEAVVAAAAAAGEVIAEQQPTEAEQGRSGHSGRPLISYSSEHHRFCSPEARQIGTDRPARIIVAARLFAGAVSGF